VIWTGRLSHAPPVTPARGHGFSHAFLPPVSESGFMRQVCAIVLTTVLAAVIGCGGNRKNFDGRLLTAFTGSRPG